MRGLCASVSGRLSSREWWPRARRRLLRTETEFGGDGSDNDESGRRPRKQTHTHEHTHVHRKPEPVGPLADVSANACEHSIAYENVFSRALGFVKQPIVGAVRTH